MVHYFRWCKILLVSHSTIARTFERTIGRKWRCMPAILGWNEHQKRGICLHRPLYQMLTTNKWQSASALGRCPLIGGSLTLKCVGSFIMCPQHSRWLLMTGVAQGRYYCIGKDEGKIWHMEYFHASSENRHSGMRDKNVNRQISCIGITGRWL